jgi:uncharacterized protein YeaO (DUF488 family)
VNSTDLRTKRIDDAPNPADGFRVLVDRLWLRGVTKQRAAVDLWLKEVSPSSDLRKWFGHRPDRFADVTARYTAALDDNPAVDRLRQIVASNPTVTLLYGEKDEAVNHAIVLADYLARL